ncbi:MAG: arsenate reductase/protein-tyrosine-phosphatase family protein [Candidatus Hodarchaeales archaeon]
MVHSLTERKQLILENFRESDQFKIIFICSGNIIRSPYAHLLFEHLIQEDMDLKKKIRAESGGVTYRNYSISAESRNMLLREGVPNEKITEFSPRYFPDYPDMFQLVDLVLVMEKNHIRKIPNSIGEQTFLFLEFTLGITDNVPDPYFDPPFERSFHMIKDALIRLMEFLKGE